MIKYHTMPYHRLSDKTIDYLMDNLTLCPNKDKTNVTIHGSAMRGSLRSKGYCYDHSVILAKDGDKIIAWALMRFIGNDCPDYMMYVDSAYRKQGIATKLFDRSKKYLKRKKAQHVKVHPWDERSEAFYKKAGLTCGLHIKL
jgi:GNAT superfamily N-acetyltransferase